jgi:hypothetical protein
MRDRAHSWEMIEDFLKESAISLPGMGSIHRVSNRLVPKQPPAYTVPHAVEAGPRTASVVAQKQTPPPPVQ